MPELEVLEAHVPVRTPRLVKVEETATERLAYDSVQGEKTRTRCEALS